MKFLSEYHVTLDSLITRDWAVSPQNESDRLREQALDSIHGDNEDKVLTAVQVMRNRYEQRQAEKHKEKLAEAKTEEFRNILLGP